MELDVKRKAAQVDEALDRWLPPESAYPPEIHRAVRYSVFAGGKRLRPLLVLCTAEIFGAGEQALPAACAVEMVHTYSLIHDDLPALDDDDFRRGRPSNHKMYGEAMAILAGDALLTYAFELLAGEAVKYLPAERALALVHELGTAAGTGGMIGGQVVDILSEGSAVSPEVLDYIHRNKTGALITCCIRMGAIAGGADSEELETLTRSAQKLGLAFQIVDDILDITGDEKKLGKKVGSDAAKKKATYPALYGLEQSRRQAESLYREGIADLDRFGPRAEPLKQLARMLVFRDS